MAKQRDTKGELRATYTRRQLRNARFNYPAGSIGVFMQVTLAITFLYLILMGYTMMGTIGVVFVSLLFLVALFSPILYRAARRLLKSRAKRVVDENRPLAPEVEPKG